ncbi:MAG: hypothetical protein KY467_01850 [Gemmatimonadetes bacterium]|nr:hypothetical protein [Gemmatimonadota bacterium]
MPSRSLRTWQVDGRRALDEIEAAHRAVGGSGRGRRFAVQQINQAYVVLLSSHFQRFCRGLHTECVEHLIGAPQYAAIRLIVYNSLVNGRKLNWGNANAGNVGSDYARLGLDIWSAVDAAGPRTEPRRQKLEQLNLWRNAVAHFDFDKPRLGGRSEVTLSEVREWRRACNALALDFDRVARAYLIGVTGLTPW